MDFISNYISCFVRRRCEFITLQTLNDNKKITKKNYQVKYYTILNLTGEIVSNTCYVNKNVQNWVAKIYNS